MVSRIPTTATKAFPVVSMRGTGRLNIIATNIAIIATNIASMKGTGRLNIIAT